MFKRFISTVLVIVLSLVLFAGCSSSQDKKKFDAQLFVNECKILTPAGQYKNIAKSEFSMIYTKNVFDEFGKSDYYKHMNDSEREAALNDLANVLMTFSYGSIEGGYIDSYSVKMDKHVVKWHNVGAEFEMEWLMPGYT